QLAARQEVGKVFLLLLLRPEVVDRRGTEAHGRLEGDADAGVGARDLLDGQAQREKVRAGPAVLLGEGQAEEAELAHLADDVVAEPVLTVELFGRRRDD